MNIKEVEFDEDLSEYMDFELKPDFRVAGKILGKKIGALSKELKSLNPKEFIDKLEEDSVVLNLNGEDTEIKKEYVEVRILSKEGYDITMDKNLFVILDTELTKELLDEGYMREFVSKVQQMRKNNDYDVVDEIKIRFEADDELFESLNKHKDEIMSETLAVSFERTELDTEEIELNDKKIKFELERI